MQNLNNAHSKTAKQTQTSTTLLRKLPWQFKESSTDQDDGPTRAERSVLCMTVSGLGKLGFP